MSAAIQMDPPSLQKRKHYEILRAELTNERSTFKSFWQDLCNFYLPTRARFQITDRNRGDRRNFNIIDATGTMAARTLSSGMMSGITSPARPWFRLTTPDPDLAESGAVKEWLHQTSERMSSIYIRSNLYNTLPTLYGDLGVIGTSPMIVEEDFDHVIRTSSFPVGSYAIAKDSNGRVNVFMREYSMTVRNIVEKYGMKDGKTGKADWTNISTHVRNLWDQGQLGAWIDVCHIIEPNIDYEPKRLHAKYKKFSSCTFEIGSQASGGNYMTQEQDKFLRESGYNYFPVLCPRWEVTAEDVYATSCPGMIALGDVKALQTMQKRKAQAVEKMIKPPMVGPPELRRQKASILPGDVTYVKEKGAFTPAHEVRVPIGEVREDIIDTRHNIQRAFFEDLFLMLSESDRRQITAREVDERHEEKLLALGPVLEQLNQDLLDPLIDITFDIMVRQRLISKPPPDLHGMPLRVEYISVMAQAQKLVAVGGLERLSNFVTNIIAQTQDPSHADKVDFDQMIEQYGDSVGTSPKVIRTDDQVAAIKQGRQQAQQQQAAVQNAKDGSQAIKNLAGADTGGENALKALMDQAKAGNVVPGGI